MSKQNYAKLEADYAKLSKQMQQFNQMMNSRVMQEAKAQAEKVFDAKRVQMVQKHNRKQELESRNHRMTLSMEAGQTKFVNINGVPSSYVVSQDGRTSQLQPITMETYQALDASSKQAFDSQFKAESLAIKYGAYNPENMNADYFSSLVICDGMDNNLLQMEMNKPMLKQESDWHMAEGAEVRKHYADYSAYQRGETLEMAEYRRINSEEGRIATGRELLQLESELKALESEVGESASYLASTGKYNSTEGQTSGE